MNNLTASYLTRAELSVLITTLMYFLMNGAQVFETLVFVPRWTNAPPSNFNLLLDGHGASLKNFWIVFHSLHEITFILAIIFCWKIDFARNSLLILFVIHFAVRVWTLAYFAPNIIHFQKIAGTPSLSDELVRRTTLWQTLNYVRVGIFIAVSLGLIPLALKLFQLRK
ncbi:transposase [Taibaiella helva]|uniref:transposase n=1 Tax=Taibaiella helva TaxID=2301235 RepID=UPI000E573F0F|nr:transposase [Taibaiella helva]